MSGNRCLSFCYYYLGIEELSQIYPLEKILFFSIRDFRVVMGIHFNHKSKAGDRKMQKELKLKQKSDERKRKREEQERLKLEEEMRQLEELTKPDK